MIYIQLYLASLRISFLFCVTALTQFVLVSRSSPPFKLSLDFHAIRYLISIPFGLRHCYCQGARLHPQRRYVQFGNRMVKVLMVLPLVVGRVRLGVRVRACLEFRY